MTLKEFEEWVDNQVFEDKLVRMRFKYKHETEWTYSNEVLEACGSDYIWLNDWDEGQQEIEVLGCVPISDIDVPLFERSRECI